MTLIVNQVGDQPFSPGDYAYSYYPDQLIAGQLAVASQNIQVVSGTVLQRGTVMGRQTTFTMTATAGTNTGNGSVGSLTPGAAIELANSGVNYALVATAPTTFTVTDPEGAVVGTATVGAPFASSELNFTITAGGTAFAVGDSFTIAYQPTVGNFIPCVSTASDGSQTPACILADYCDASAGPARCGAYFMGEFNIRAITYDNSWSLPNLVAALQPRGIHLKTSVSAADPFTNSNDPVA